MAREFDSFFLAAGHWKTKVKPAVKRNMQNDLRGIAVDVQQVATQSVGHYQQAMDPFPAWKPLAPATIARKSRGNGRKSWGLNGNPDSPLYRTGKFKKSIFYRINQRQLTATIGTTKEYVVKTELGTGYMPARPVFGPAAMRVVPNHVSIVRSGLVSGLMGTFAGGRATGLFLHR